MGGSKLNDEQKEAAAHAALHGATTRELAIQYGYTAQGMRALMKSDGMRSIMADKLQRLEQSAAYGRLKILERFEDIVDTSISMATNEAHPSCATMNKHLQGVVGLCSAPEAQQVAHTVDHVFTPEINELISIVNDKLRDAPAFDTRFVHEGEEALPNARLRDVNR